jgi:hypothetical protein|tara:strand:+ start:2433 stop:2795 length:363 start_codon:yes stop_codon:yes gene_type:complete
MQKVVGQPCPDCNTPFIQGQKGAYCKSCYIKWKNNQQPAAVAPQPIKADVDWKEVGRGKVKHGFAIEAFKKDMPLDVKTATLINNWTAFVMDNKLGTQYPDEEQTITPEEPAAISGNVPF